MFIIDAHLDLAMNAMEWNRDLTKSIQEINLREKKQTDKPDRGNATVCFDELRKGNIGLVVATQIARFVKPNSPISGWNSPQQAFAQTQAQLAWYKEMEAIGELKMITNKIELNEHIAYWHDKKNNHIKKKIGYILSLEGADSLVRIDYVEKSYNQGLRIIGPAHYLTGRYANGTDSNGKMKKNGIALLKKMNELKMILDLTHLCPEAFWQAIELYEGPCWASHNNCQKFVEHNRQFTDQQIKAIIQKKGIIGAALDAWMLVPNWQRGVSNPQKDNCNLNQVVQNIDHICQIAGNSLHVGIGSDLDGAFGTEQCPKDLKTIADLQKLIKILTKWGYNKMDLKNIFHQNILHFLETNL